MKKNLILVMLLLLLSTFYAYLFFNYNFPLRNRDNDHYSFIANSIASSNYWDNSLDKNNFPNVLITSLHTNVATLLYGYLFTVFHNPIIISGIIGSINIFLFYLSFYCFLSQFIPQYTKKLFAIFLLLLSTPINTTFSTIGSGLYDLASIPIFGFTFQLTGYTLFFFSFIIVKKFIKEEHFSYLLFITLLTTALLNIHPFIYFSLAIYIVMVMFTDIYKTNKINIKIILFLILSQIINLTINQFVWPFSKILSSIYYSTIQFQSGLIAKGIGNYAVNNIYYYFENLSISLIGYIFLLKEKNTFIKITVIVLSLLVFQLFLPINFKIPMVWRLIHPLKFLLILLIAKNIFAFRSKIFQITILFFIIVLSAMNISHTLKLTFLRKNDFLIYKEVADSKICNTKPLVLSDLVTSNLLQAINGCSTFLMGEGHIAEARLIVRNNTRIDEIINLSLNNNPDKNFLYMKKNNISEIIIDKNLQSDISVKINNLQFPYNTKDDIFTNDSLKIMKIKLN